MDEQLWDDFKQYIKDNIAMTEIDEDQFEYIKQQVIFCINCFNNVDYIREVKEESANLPKYRRKLVNAEGVEFVGDDKHIVIKNKLISEKIESSNALSQVIMNLHIMSSGLTKDQYLQTVTTASPLKTMSTIVYFYILS